MSTDTPAAAAIQPSPGEFALRRAVKPPLGLRPKFVADMTRMEEIRAAVERYEAAELPVPPEWVEEYDVLYAGLPEIIRKRSEAAAKSASDYLPNPDEPASQAPTLGA